MFGDSSLIIAIYRAAFGAKVGFSCFGLAIWQLGVRIVSLGVGFSVWKALKIIIPSREIPSVYLKMLEQPWNPKGGLQPFLFERRLYWFPCLFGGGQ